LKNLEVHNSTSLLPYFLHDNICPQANNTSSHTRNILSYENGPRSCLQASQ